MAEDKARRTLTEAEFCREVGISRTTAWEYRRNGLLPYCKIARKILYKNPEHVEAFLRNIERGRREVAA